MSEKIRNIIFIVCAIFEDIAKELMRMGYFKNLLFLLYIRLFRKDISADFACKIQLNTLNNLAGNKVYQILLNNSTLSGDIQLGCGCRINSAICYGKIKMGRFVSVNGPGTRISSNLNGIDIGSFTSIAPNVIIQEEFHRIDKVSSYFMNNNIFLCGASQDITTKGKILIEEDVWIGANTVVLSGVRIGRGSVIGAGSIVTKDIPRYSIAVGNPARVIKNRFPDNIIEQIENSKWWEWEIDKILRHKESFNKNITVLNNKDIFDTR